MITITAGEGTQLLGTKKLEGVACPHCGKTGTITISIYQNYVYIWAVPTFARRKKYVCHCDNCQQTFEDKKTMPAVFLPTINELNKEYKTPLKKFTGLIALMLIIPAFILTLYISSSVNHDTNSKLILDPQVGDVYQIYLGDYKYTLYKVAEVRGDSVKVLRNEYESGDPRKLRRGEAEDAFYGGTLYFTKGQLKEMFDNSKIDDIDRD